MFSFMSVFFLGSVHDMIHTINIACFLLNIQDLVDQVIQVTNISLPLHI